MMKNINYLFYIFFATMVFYAGCKKETAPKPVLKSEFTSNKTTVQQGDTVSFTNLSQEAFAYQWYFGDGGTSTLENPEHVYDSAGGFKVLLRAIGSFRADSSYGYITVKPLNPKIIHEGKKIDEISLGDKWSKVQTVLPPVDTNYYFSYLPKYGLYSNLIYYPKIGIVAGFLSATGIVADSDSVYEVFVVVPYHGVTSKGATIGSTLSDVMKIYGTPENGYLTYSSTGYLYPSKGIDFFTYNSVDTALVSEIDIYYPNSTTSGSINKVSGTGESQFSHFSHSP